MIGFIYFFLKDKSLACHGSILKSFASHTDLKCIAQEWESQNIREENWLTLNTRELVLREMQPYKNK